MSQFRNYQDSVYQDRVERTYREMFENQTVRFVQGMLHKYRTGTGIHRSIWEVTELLNQVHDESDPDNDLPQIVHAFQTAESLKTRYLKDGKLKDDISVRGLFSDVEWNGLSDEVRRMYHGKMLHEMYAEHRETMEQPLRYEMDDWEWLPLVGFIHDLGKVISLEEFGGLAQWAVVGDTFPVGCEVHPSNLFYDKGFFRGNPDYGVEEYQGLGMYEEGCGLENLLMSWGHDEYLATVLERAGCKVPREGIYLIRFHSFYAWHTPRNGQRAYENLASDFDWYMLPLLKAFQKSDLYSKSFVIPKMEEIKEGYQGLIDRYFDEQVIEW